MYQFFNPVRTYLGNGSFQNMNQIIEESVGMPKSVVMVIWHEAVLEIKVVKEFMEKATYHVNPIVFNKANPTIENLYELYQQSREVEYDLVLAIGGGSVLDVAKILACIKDMKIENEEDVRRNIHEKSYETPSCKWIGVPTTAGTGSEVTCWATIWDMTKGKKLSVERQDNYAVAAVVDADFTTTMPMELAVSSALDAVAHATESYWAKGRNPVTKAMALYGIKSIMDNIDGLIENYGEVKYHDAMATGSMIAGLAFSNTRTTACHSISYPLTMHFGIPHGVAVSMLIAPMIVFNDECMEDKEALLDVFGVKDVLSLRKRMDEVLKKAKIQVQLRNWNVKESDISFLVENAFTKGRIDNNPRVLAKEDVEMILRSIY